MTAVIAPDHIIPTYKRWPIEIVSGSGCRVVDVQGRSYLDMTAGIAVASVGHAHPVVAEAIAAQARRLTHISNLYVTAPQSELSDRLAGLTGGMLSFFTNSGAEAIECALKLTRKWARSIAEGKHRIVAAEGAFHGRTLGALSATGQPAKRDAFEPLVPGFTHVPFGDIETLEKAMGEDVAAVLLEPIQGEAGVIVPPDGYLAAVRALCDRAGALLILDEIQTGMGRTGTWFAYEHDDVRPDILCLAKALGGGLPIGACLATPNTAAAFGAGDHASTFGGGPVQCAAALATISVIETEGLLERANRAGATLRDGLVQLFASHATVRGRGLLLGVELDRPIARDVVRGALERGVLVNDATPDVVRLSPPLVISDDEIEVALRVLEEVWDEVAAA
ncbi:MAG: acetylornithine transaminase [Actinomycetota bacterium]|nr:acetylornithine transaminase [Actinomycetota bacterium]